MSGHPSHPMMPSTTHDEYSRNRFLMSFKNFIQMELDPLDRQLVDEVARPAYQARHGRAATSSQEVRPLLEAEPFHQFWLSAMRHQQELMWDNVSDCVARQLPELAERYANRPRGQGTLRLDPAFRQPTYITAFDNHRMPGSYHSEAGEDDLRAGALFDGAAALYHVNRNGGAMNDARGWTLIDHVKTRFPALSAPRRILDLGCCVGQSTLTYCEQWPEAEVYGIDLGAPLLRYAHARSEYLGRTVHFSQQNAEQTDFPDGHFDLIVSTAMLHETSRPATRRIFAECLRLLRPGGVMAHLEVPVRYADLGVWEQVRVDWECQVNNEPFIAGSARLDMAAMATELGFSDAAAGYHWQVPGFIPGKRGFETAGGPGGSLKLGSWYLVSAARPA
jgi:SAM-dependent methyltransferase